MVRLARLCFQALAVTNGVMVGFFAARFPQFRFQYARSGMYSSPSAVPAGMSSESRIWSSNASGAETSRHYYSREGYIGLSAYSHGYGSNFR